MVSMVDHIIHNRLLQEYVDDYHLLIYYHRQNVIKTRKDDWFEFIELNNSSTLYPTMSHSENDKIIYTILNSLIHQNFMD